MKPLGLGIDLVNINRIKKLHERYGERFLKKVFTQEELEYAFSKRYPYNSLASAFAVKEAFYKAIGGYSPFRFKEITLLRDLKSGNPFLRLTGTAREVFNNRGCQKVFLSISHEVEYTIAIVQLFGE